MSGYYLLGLSSNAEPQKHIGAMLKALLLEFGELLVSRVVITEPFGTASVEEYCNAAVLLRSERSHESLKHWSQSLEDKLGRDRNRVQRSLAVTADLDILACGSLCSGLSQLPLDDEPYYRPLVAELLALSRGESEALLPARTTEVRLDDLSLGAKPLVLESVDQRVRQIERPSYL